MGCVISVQYLRDLHKAMFYMHFLNWIKKCAVFGGALPMGLAGTFAETAHRVIHRLCRWRSGLFGEQQQVARGQAVEAEGAQADVVALFLQVQGAVEQQPDLQRAAKQAAQ